MPPTCDGAGYAKSWRWYRPPADPCTETITVFYCGKSDSIDVTVRPRASGSLSGGGACPGQDTNITAQVYNPMGCAETFSWQVQKKAAPDGGEASVNFTPSSDSTGSVAAQSWSAAIPITVTVGAGSPPGSVANIELIVEVSAAEATDPDNRPDAVIGVPGQNADGSIGGANDCPGATIEIAKIITNRGACEESFDWRIVKINGDLSFATISGSTPTLEPSESDSTPANYTIPGSAAPGETATVDLQIKLNGTYVVKDTATIGVPSQSADGFVDDASGCPGGTIQIPKTIINTGACEDSFAWRIVQIDGDLSFATISSSTPTLQPGEPDTTPAIYTIPADAVPGEWAVVQLEVELNGTYVYKDDATIVVDCPTFTVVSKDPYKPSADTNWPLMPHDFATSIITVQWDPPECASVAELRIVRPPGEYHPIDDRIVPIGGDPTRWKYTSFKEPKGKKRPSSVDVTIEAVVNGVVCNSVNQVLQILTVHNFWTGVHCEGPGGPCHAPTNDDYWQDYKYITWKYQDVMATTGGAFATETILSTECAPCGVCPPACTDDDANVEFGLKTFSGSENQTASIIGHELVHTTQDYGWFTEDEDECEAYCWEWRHRFCTGIDQDGAALQSVRDGIQQYCDHNENGCPNADACTE